MRELWQILFNESQRLFQKSMNNQEHFSNIGNNRRRSTKNQGK